MREPEERIEVAAPRSQACCSSPDIAWRRKASCSWQAADQGFSTTARWAGPHAASELSQVDRIRAIIIEQRCSCEGVDLRNESAISIAVEWRPMKSPALSFPRRATRSSGCSAMALSKAIRPEARSCASVAAYWAAASPRPLQGDRQLSILGDLRWSGSTSPLRRTSGKGEPLRFGAGRISHAGSSGSGDLSQRCAMTSAAFRHWHVASNAIILSVSCQAYQVRGAASVISVASQTLRGSK